VNTIAPTHMPITKLSELKLPSEVITTCRSGHPPITTPIIPTAIPPTTARMTYPNGAFLFANNLPDVSVNSLRAWKK
jgi:hypothetical protein